MDKREEIFTFEGMEHFEVSIFQTHSNLMKIVAQFGSENHACLFLETLSIFHEYFGKKLFAQVWKVSISGGEYTDELIKEVSV
jgi:hypothetical protein